MIQKHVHIVQPPRRCVTAGLRFMSTWAKNHRPSFDCYTTIDQRKKKKKQMDKKKCSFVFSLFPVLCEKFPLQIIRELTTSNKKLSIVRVCVFQQGALYFFIDFYRSTGYVTYTTSTTTDFYVMMAAVVVVVTVFSSIHTNKLNSPPDMCAVKGKEKKIRINNITACNIA